MLLGELVILRITWVVVRAYLSSLTSESGAGDTILDVASSSEKGMVSR